MCVLGGDQGKNTETTFETAAEWTTSMNLPAVNLPGVGLVVDLPDVDIMGQSMVGRATFDLVSQAAVGLATGGLIMNLVALLEVG